MESQREKVKIGKIDIPKEYEKHMKHVAKDGTIFATPPGGQKYTEAQRKSVDDAVKKTKAVFVEKAKKLRGTESEALKELKKDPMNDKRRSAYKDAKDARAEYDKQRKTAEAKAVREAREKALK